MYAWCFNGLLSGKLFNKRISWLLAFNKLWFVTKIVLKIKEA